MDEKLYRGFTIRTTEGKTGKTGTVQVLIDHGTAFEPCAHFRFTIGKKGSKLAAVKKAYLWIEGNHESFARTTPPAQAAALPAPATDRHQQ